METRTAKLLTLINSASAARRRCRSVSAEGRRGLSWPSPHVLPQYGISAQLVVIVGVGAR